MRSWEVRLAAALVWLGMLPALVCFRVGLDLMGTSDLLFVITPIVMCVVWGAGLVLAAATITLALELHTKHALARLHTFLLGASGVLVGLVIVTLEPLVGTLIVGWGALLAWLMTSGGAAADLGDWLVGARVTAPWGSTPGKGIWSPEPQQQGPWAPDPTTLPWLTWRGHSGPRPPWWQTWQAGLARGMPVWELVVLGLSVLLLGAALVAVVTGSATGVLLLAPALSGAFLVEQRMRRRLAGGR